MTGEGLKFEHGLHLDAQALKSTAHIRYARSAGSPMEAGSLANTLNDATHQIGIGTTFDAEM